MSRPQRNPNLCAGASATEPATGLPLCLAHSLKPAPVRRHGEKPRSTVVRRAGRPGACASPLCANTLTHLAVRGRPWRRRGPGRPWRCGPYSLCWPLVRGRGPFSRSPFSFVLSFEANVARRMELTLDNIDDKVELSTHVSCVGDPHQPRGGSDLDRTEVIEYTGM